MKRTLTRILIVLLAVLSGYAVFAATGPTILVSGYAVTNSIDLGVRLLISFGTGLLIITTYTGYAAYNEQEDRDRRINDMTQSYSGIVLLFSILAILGVSKVTDWTIGDLYIAFSATVLTVSLLTLKRYNRLIEKYA